jgi:predicted MFS family arabinose efflux permease
VPPVPTPASASSCAGSKPGPAPRSNGSDRRRGCGATIVAVSLWRGRTDIATSATHAPAPESPGSRQIKKPNPDTTVILAVGFLILFIGGGARFTIGLTLKPMADSFGWARSELGGGVALFQLVGALSMFAAGYLADRASPRLVLGGGLLVAGIGIGSMAAITASWQVLLLYGVIFAIGNGAASMIPVGVMVTREFRNRTGMANAVVMSGMSVGQLVIIAVMAALLSALSWRTVYLLVGIAHLVLILPVLGALTRTPSRSAETAVAISGLGLAAAAGKRQFWLLNAIYAICGFDDFFVSTHLVALAQDQGAGIVLAGDLLAAMGLTGLIGVVAAGALSDRLGPVWPTALAFAARVLVFALLLFDHSVATVTIFALVFGATFLVTAPLTVVFVTQNFGSRNLGTLTGLITMVHQVSGGIGAYLGAASFDATGSYQGTLWLMLALSLLALVLTLFLPSRRRVLPA